MKSIIGLKADFSPVRLKQDVHIPDPRILNNHLSSAFDELMKSSDNNTIKLWAVNSYLWEDKLLACQQRGFLKLTNHLKNIPSVFL